MKCRGRNVATQEQVEVEFDTVIQYVEPVLDPAADSDTTFLSAGFVDLQVNGFAGVDFNSPSTPHEEIARALRVLFSTGVTRIFPTVITGEPAAMLGTIRNLAAAHDSLEDGEVLEGIHVEGPHISPEDGPRGAHPREWVRAPNFEEFLRWQEAARGLLRLVTLSPEWSESIQYIERVTREGVVVSIGHTAATEQQIRDAVSAGASLSTHLGNAAHAVLPRRSNYIWGQLAQDRLAASFIVDGLHLTDSFLKVALRAKGIERSILITDAVMPAMCAPGPYELGGVEIELKDDQRVVLRGGTRLAGSSLRMDHAVANAIRIAGLSLTEAVTMATINPARIGRLVSRQRGIRAGERADLVRFRFENGRIEVLETFVGGRRVFAPTQSAV